MITASGSLARFDQVLAGMQGDLPGTSLDWLQAQRNAAGERFRELGFPSRKQEGWRYTSLEKLLAQPFLPAGARPPAIAESELESLLVPGLESHRLVLLNGGYAPELSRAGELPGGVQLYSLRDALENRPGLVEALLDRPESGNVEVFTLLNTLGLDDGLVLIFEQDARIEEPIEILHLSVDTGAAHVAQPRHLLVLEAGAQASVVERYASVGNPVYFNNSLLDLRLGKGASLRHHRVQQESSQAFHLAKLRLRQGADSRYRGASYALGAGWSRTEIDVDFAEPGAENELDGLYLAGDGQLVDFHLNIEHQAAGCTSRETFKGILSGRGRAVFDGRVCVQKDAQKTDAQLNNANLLLSRNAEVDTKPQLEINADDVRCSHGTTVGQIEPDMLFYLRARGIPADEARKMLCLGFAGEVVEACGPPALRDYVAGCVGEHLSAADRSNV